MGLRIGDRIIIGLIAAFSVGVEAQTSSQEVPGFQKYRVIFEKSMFGRGRGVDRKEQKAGQDQALVPATPADVKVIGIIKADAPLMSIAIIEQDGKHRLRRIGDTIGTMVIRDIRANEVVLEAPGGRWVAEIEPGAAGDRAIVSQTGRAPVAAAPIRRGRMGPAGGRLAVKAADIPRLVGTVGLVLDTREGATKGLRLTRDFLGLKEGDCVTRVGYQSLDTRSPRQKLWQIARKYSGYGREMPEIPIVIERDGRELEFVLSLSI